MIAYRKLLALAVFAGAVFAQSENSGTVLGTVLDPSGAVVGGVAVDLRNPGTGYSQTVATDSAGVFRFNNVPRGAYQLEQR